MTVIDKDSRITQNANPSEDPISPQFSVLLPHALFSLFSIKILEVAPASIFPFQIIVLLSQNTVGDDDTFFAALSFLVQSIISYPIHRIES